MSANADVNIGINATDNATAVVDSATKKINRSWISMRNQQRAVQREFELNHRTLTQTTRILQTVGATVQRLISIYNTWQLLQIRSALSTKNLRDAQRDVNDAFLEFGGTSKEYQDALMRQKEVQEQARNDAKETTITYGLMAFAILSHGASLVTRGIPPLIKYGRALDGLKNKILGIKPPVLTAPVTKTPTVTPPVKSPVQPSGTAPVKTTEPTLPKTNQPTGSPRGTITEPPAKLPSPRGTAPELPKLPSPSRLSGLFTGLLSGIASAGLFLATLAGEQNVHAPSDINPKTGKPFTEEEFARGEHFLTEDTRAPETSVEAIQQIGKELNITINNYINSPTSQEMVDEIAEQSKNSITYAQQALTGGE